VVDYLAWRQADAARSALNNWCYWTLRQEGQTAGAATAVLDRASTADKNELLFARGINFNDTPTWQRRGTGLQRETYQKAGRDPRDGTTTSVTRRRIRQVDDLPVKDEYRAFLRAVLDGPVRGGTLTDGRAEPA
jgi:tRNA(His) 5'-end guanylyltransferase